ncbi:MAG: hypothetical protein HUU02_11725 [Bacteroidetes bacterium]|nr:hypothetical protein [Bacteroidota bacterium]
MTRIFWMFQLSAAFFLLSCESPLSDAEITDPGLIAPEVTVVKSRDYRTIVSYAYECIIRDKDGKFVVLKNGSVLLNKYAMNLTESLFDYKYYSLPGTTIPYSLGKPYIFTVRLANGSSYDAVVVTPVIDLSALAAPANVTPPEQMFLQWAGIDSNVVMHFELKIYYRLNGEQSMTQRSIDIPAPKAAKFYLTPEQYLSPVGTTYGVEVTLVAELEGTIDPRFGKNGKATARQSVSKLVGVL